MQTLAVRWANSHLARANEKTIDSIAEDLRDGLLLFRLVLLVTEEPRDAPDTGDERLNTLGRLQAVIDRAFREQGPRARILPQSIIDGSETETHELLARLMDLEIELTVDGSLHGREALLAWAQRSISGSASANMPSPLSLAGSFASGEAFCTLLAAHTLLPGYDARVVKHQSAADNIQLVLKSTMPHAFLTADDFEDDFQRATLALLVSVQRLALHRTRAAEAGARLVRMCTAIKETNDMQCEYVERVSDLLRWIHFASAKLSDTPRASTDTELQHMHDNLTTFRTSEKNPKFAQKVDIEAMFLALQTKLRATNRPLFVPPPGKSLDDLVTAWRALEQSEKTLEDDIQQQRERLRKLEETATRFRRKVGLRLRWLEDIKTQLMFMDFELSASSLDAARKKQEAFEVDVLTHQERIDTLLMTAEELAEENYKDDSGEVRLNAEIVEEEWGSVLLLVQERRKKIDSLFGVLKVYQDISAADQAIWETSLVTCSDHLGIGVQGVHDQRAKLAVAQQQLDKCVLQVTAIERVAERFRAENHSESSVVTDRHESLARQLQGALSAAQRRDTALRERLEVEQIVQDLEEEDTILVEFDRILASSRELGKDLTGVHSLVERHEQLTSSLGAHEVRLLDMQRRAATLHADEQREDVGNALAAINRHWQAIKEAMTARRDALAESRAAHVYAVEVDETLTLASEKAVVFASELVGGDYDSTTALLKRHDAVLDDLRALEQHIEAQQEQGDALKRTTVHRELACALISEKQSLLQSRMGELQTQADDRKRRLTRQLSFHQYHADLADVESWMMGCEETVSKHEQLLSHRKNKKKPKTKMNQEKMKDGIDATEVKDDDDDDDDTDDDDDDNDDDDDEEDTAVDKSGKNASELPARLHKRYGDLQRELKAHERRVPDVCQAADALIGEAHPESNAIASERDTLFNRWRKLEALVAKRVRVVGAAQEVRAHEESLDAIVALMEMKKAPLMREETGKDVEEVESFQRQCDAATRDLETLARRLVEKNDETERLAAAHPVLAKDLRAKQRVTVRKLEQLTRRVVDRKKRLNRAFEHFAFTTLLKETTTELGAIQQLMITEELPRNLIKAEADMSNHKALRERLKRAGERCKMCLESGSSLVSGKDSVSSLVSSQLKKLMVRKDRLDGHWELRRVQLMTTRDMLSFYRDADQADSWMASGEALLSDNDCGDSYFAAESLLRKYNEFMRTMPAASDTIAAVDAFARGIGDAVEASDRERVLGRIRHVMERWDKFVSRAMVRGRALEASMNLHKFYRQVQEASMWLETRRKYAEDDSFKQSLSHMDSKRRKHQEITAEIQVRQSQLALVLEDGQALISGATLPGGDDSAKMTKSAASPTPPLPHPEADTVRLRIRHVRDGLEALMHAMNTKETALNDLHSVAALHRETDTLEDWAQGALALLQSLDTSRDLASVQAQWRKLHVIVDDVAKHRDAFPAIAATAQALLDRDCTGAELVKAKKASLLELQAQLNHAVESQRVVLVEAEKFYTLSRDADELSSWLHDHSVITEQLVASPDLSSDRIETLIKKCAKHRDGMSANRERVHALEGSAKALSFDKHPRADEARQLIGQLRDEWDNVQAGIDAKQVALAEALKVQDFYRETDEVTLWMRDKLEDMENNVVPGHDLQLVQTMQRHAEVLKADVGRVRLKVTALEREAARFAESHEDHRERIEERRVGAVNALHALVIALSEHGGQLQAALDYQGFLTSVRESLSWVGDMQRKFHSDDIGSDLATAEALSAQHSLDGRTVEEYSESKVGFVEEVGESLLQAAHPSRAEIVENLGLLKAEVATTRALWRQRSARLELHCEELDFDGEKQKIQAWYQGARETIGAGSTLEELSHGQGKTHTKRFDELVQAQTNQSTHVARFQRYCARVLDAYKRSLVEVQSEEKEAAAAKEKKTKKKKNDVEVVVEEQEEAVAAEGVEEEFDFSSDGGAMSELDEEDASLKSGSKKKSEAAAEEAEHCKKSQAEQQDEDEGEEELADDAAADARAEKLKAKAQEGRDNDERVVQLSVIMAESGSREAARAFAEHVQTSLDSILAEWTVVRELVATHGKRVENYVNVHRLLRLTEEATGWIEDHLTNLEKDASKAGLVTEWGNTPELVMHVQKHAALMDAIETQRAQIEGNVMRGLAEAGIHVERQSTDTDTERVEENQVNVRMASRGEGTLERVRALPHLWKRLCERASELDRRLREATELRKHNAGTDELEMWIQQKKPTLVSTAVAVATTTMAGSTLTTTTLSLPQVQAQLRNHAVVETDIEWRGESVAAARDEARRMVAAEHRDASAIHARTDSIVREYEEMKALAAERREALEGALALCLFFRDVRDEEQWIEEKLQLATAVDTGQGLMSVQNLQKQLRVLVAQLAAHEPMVHAVEERRAAVLAKATSDAEREVVVRRLDELRGSWLRLQDAVKARQDLLTQADAYFAWRAEVDKLSQWAMETRAVLESEEYGDSLFTTGALLKRHADFEVEFAQRRRQLVASIGTGREMVSTGHFREDVIIEQLEQVGEEVHSLSELRLFRQSRLEDRRALHEFIRDVDALEAWTREQREAASGALSGSIGTSIEEIVRQQKSQEMLLGVLQSNRGRVEQIERDGAALVERLRDDVGENENGDENEEANEDSEVGMIERHMAHAQSLWRSAVDAAESYMARLSEVKEERERVLELQGLFARGAAELSNWLQAGEEDLTDPIVVKSVAALAEIHDGLDDYVDAVEAKEALLNKLREYDASVRASQQRRKGEAIAMEEGPDNDNDSDDASDESSDVNPLTRHTLATLEMRWEGVRQLMDERRALLDREQRRQEDHERRRSEYRVEAETLSQLCATIRSDLAVPLGSLESQRECVERVMATLRHRRGDLDRLRRRSLALVGAGVHLDVGGASEQQTETVASLTQQWVQLEELAGRMEINIGKMMRQRAALGVSASQLEEYGRQFAAYDGQHKGYLEYDEFVAFLEALGERPDDESAMDVSDVLCTVDVAGLGRVSHGDFVAFMVARELRAENQPERMLEAFGVLSGGGVARAVDVRVLEETLSPELAKFCRDRMDEEGDGGRLNVAGFAEAVYGGGRTRAMRVQDAVVVQRQKRRDEQQTSEWEGERQRTRVDAERRASLVSLTRSSSSSLASLPGGHGGRARVSRGDGLAEARLKVARRVSAIRRDEYVSIAEMRSRQLDQWSEREREYRAGVEERMRSRDSSASLRERTRKKFWDVKQ